MPVRVEKISVDFDPYSEPVNIVTRKCYPCKQVKHIDCFKRCYCTGKHSYSSIKYTMTCSECLGNDAERIKLFQRNSVVPIR